jgi:purine-binding chemotaxis protein CheW
MNNRKSGISNTGKSLQLAPGPAELSEMDILEERARALARRPAAEIAADEALHLITFRLGSEFYAVEIALVQEAQPLQRQNWSPVPCAPDFIIGAVKLRGRIYSVMDIGRFLGLPVRPLSDTAHILLVGGDNQGGEPEMELTILADSRPTAINIPRAEVHPPVATISLRGQKYVRGVTNEMLVILDLSRLLADDSIIVDEAI